MFKNKKRYLKVYVKSCGKIVTNHENSDCYFLLLVLINRYKNVSDGFIQIGFPALEENHKAWGRRGRSQLSAAALVHWVLPFWPAPSHGRVTDLGQDRVHLHTALSTRQNRPSHSPGPSPYPSTAKLVAWPCPDSDALHDFACPTPRWLQVEARDAGPTPRGSRDGAGSAGARR